MKEAMVLAVHNIVYFGPGKLNGMWRNRHQLMSRFAPQNMVIYVEPIFSIHKLCKQLTPGLSWKKYRDATTFERYQSLKHNF